ncbi:unnamed protein product, partial [Ectocarpus sp. 4 AP-2014]
IPCQEFGGHARLGVGQPYQRRAAIKHAVHLGKHIHAKKNIEEYIGDGCGGRKSLFPPTDPPPNSQFLTNTSLLYVNPAASAPRLEDADSSLSLLSLHEVT